jgi:hypothetical protein
MRPAGPAPPETPPLELGKQALDLLDNIRIESLRAVLLPTITIGTIDQLQPFLVTVPRAKSRHS